MAKAGMGLMSNAAGTDGSAGPRNTAPAVEARTSVGLEDRSARAMWSQEAVLRIPVSIRIVLGTAKMTLSKLLDLKPGVTIPLDRRVGDMVDIFANDRLLARGEVVVLDDAGEKFAIAIREVARSDE